ncbi:MAG: tRNA guanosine(15) transglycosylase TgtA [Candidatus Thermoplasmatota archaeon]|nr:tRNA guanosine(15) transglycosylase TgtA [Candidatus Thermoplasmatota archaeon]
MELLRRDGSARICSFETPHGKIVTPNLFPVINPNINLLSLDDLRQCGADCLITNSYIIRRDPDLRDKALSAGVHGLLGFNGPVMTDSGTFQSYVYGDMEFDNVGMVDFQRVIGSDISTIVDVFSVPEDSRQKAREAVLETAKRYSEVRGNDILAAPIQGSVYPDLRSLSARLMTKLAPEYYAIGGVVPLLESYNYSTLVTIISRVKRNIDPSKPVHLFGAGHPMFLPLAVLMGIDLFDSSSYAKYARENRLLFPEGTRNLSDLEEFPWWSNLNGYKSRELSALDDDDRIRLLTMHNLRSIFHEIREIREQIREEKLLEYTESRARGNPALWKAFITFMKKGIDASSFSMSKRRPFYYFDSLSKHNPVVRNLVLFSNKKLRSSGETGIIHPDLWNVIRNDANKIRDLFCMEKSEIFFFWNSIPVPLELMFTYPVQQSLSALSYSGGKIPSFLKNVHVIRDINDLHDQKDCSFEATVLRTIYEFQFHIQNGLEFLDDNIQIRVSRKTGRIRTVSMNGKILATLRPSDGFLVLTLDGARLIHDIVDDEVVTVEVDNESAQFNKEGKNVFSKFVRRSGKRIHPGSEVMVKSEDELIAVGKALLSGREMMFFRRGVAVEVRQGSSSR